LLGSEKLRINNLLETRRGHRKKAREKGREEGNSTSYYSSNIYYLTNTYFGTDHARGVALLMRMSNTHNITEKRYGLPKKRSCTSTKCPVFECE